MALCRASGVSMAVVGLVLALAAATGTRAAERESKLATSARAAERILVAIPEQRGVAPGKTIDIAPGEKFIVEIQRALRGTGKKSSPALIIQGGDAEKHPRFVAGKPYLFLLKKNPETNRWMSLGTTEIPVKDGKAQLMDSGKIVDEMSLDALEELFVSEASAATDLTRDTLTGNWLVVFSDLNKGFDIYAWLVELLPDGAEGDRARLVASSKQMQASRLKTATIDGDDVRLILEADGVTFDFRGHFENGALRGNCIPERNLVLAARLVPTASSSMKGFDGPVGDPAREEFLDAAGQEDSIGPLSRFVRKHPKSPLALAAGLMLVGKAREADFDRSKFEPLAREYLDLARLWGSRMELRAYVELGLFLSTHEYLPEIALEYLNRADSLLDDESPRSWKAAIGIERGKRLIGAGDASGGTALLREFHEDEPFNADITYALARQAEKEKKVDEALALYGEIAVLPLLENSLVESLKSVGQKLPREQYPSRVAIRLWTGQHGDRQGMTEWFDALYASRMRSLARERRPPRGPEDGTKVALLELFTNGCCEPCVAADAAVAAMEATYAKSEVIVLDYHQPKPGPDPLANEESIERFKHYQGSETPTLILNGRRVVGAGGFLPEAPILYRRLLSFVEPLLAEKTDLRIEMTAQARGDAVTLSATAQGFKTFPPSARLMLVLAEERVDLTMSNGIRAHEMVVRQFPGGVGGVTPVKGQLAYTGKVDLAGLRKQLARQIAADERENNYQFTEKPLSLKSLQFVALLQNIETGEVLQAAAIPVVDELREAGDAKPAPKPSPVARPAASGN